MKIKIKEFKIMKIKKILKLSFICVCFTMINSHIKCFNTSYAFENSNQKLTHNLNLDLRNDSEYIDDFNNEKQFLNHKSNADFNISLKNIKLIKSYVEKIKSMVNNLKFNKLNNMLKKYYDYLNTQNNKLIIEYVNSYVNKLKMNFSETIKSLENLIKHFEQELNEANKSFYYYQEKLTKLKKLVDRKLKFCKQLEDYFVMCKKHVEQNFMQINSLNNDGSLNLEESNLNLQPQNVNLSDLDQHNFAMNTYMFSGFYDYEQNTQNYDKNYSDTKPKDNDDMDVNLDIN